MPPVDNGAPGRGIAARLARLLNAPNDNPAKTVAVALCVALAGSLLVAGSTLLLKPRIDANRAAERQRFLVELVQQIPGVEVMLGELKIGKVETRVVDFQTGEYVAGADPAQFDPRKAAEDPSQSVAIPPERDSAGLKRRPRRAAVHLVSAKGKLQLVILPVYGRGFASMLYGYLGLSGDAETVVGLSFYQHGETPGLGGLIDSPKWRARWRGKKLRDAEGRLRTGVARGAVPPQSPDAPYMVDGLTGATWTSRGVHGLLRFWLGPDGFGPYLDRLRKEGG